VKIIEADSPPGEAMASKILNGKGGADSEKASLVGEGPQWESLCKTLRLIGDVKNKKGDGFQGKLKWKREKKEVTVLWGKGRENLSPSE